MVVVLTTVIVLGVALLALVFVLRLRAMAPPYDRVSDAWRTEQLQQRREDSRPK